MFYQPGSPFQSDALQDIDFTIEDGELLALIGHTGSGKSTLAQHLNGLLTPTSGRVLVDGEAINQKGANRRALRQRVGLLFQYAEYQLFEETVYKDIAFGPKNQGLTGDELDAACARPLPACICPRMRCKNPPLTFPAVRCAAWRWQA